jgi:putative peptidoglycan lipid II flippase
MVHRTINAVGIATIANLIGRAANVTLPLAIIAVFGANANTDQFFLVLALGFFCYGTVANAIAESTVPLLISLNRRLCVSNILKHAAGATLLSLLVGITWHWITGQIDLVYATALALMVGAGIANGFFTGILHAQERYAPTGLTWALRFVPLIGLLLIEPKAGQLAWLAIGIGVMDWLRCVILFSCGRHAPLSGEPIDLKKFINRYRSTYGTVLIAMLVMGFNPLIDRLIAQLSGPGGISILDAAERVYGILGALCTMGLMTVLLTRFSQDAANNRLDRRWPSLMKTLAAWCLVWMVMGILGGRWGLDIWLAKGTNLSARQCVTVKLTYWYYLIGLPAFVTGVAYAKRLQAVRRTTILAMVSLMAVILNLIASLALQRTMGIPGIALATTLVYTATCIVLMTATHRIARKSK